MSTESPLDPELTAVARRLADLAPVPANLPRDRLLYLAGQAAGERRPRGRAMRVLLAAVALSAGVVLGRVAPREPVVVERVVQVPLLPGPAPAAPMASGHNPVADIDPRPANLPDPFLIHRELLSGELPATVLPPEGPQRAWSLDELLILPPGSLDDATKRRWEAVLHSGDPS